MSLDSGQDRGGDQEEVVDSRDVRDVFRKVAESSGGFRRSVKVAEWTSVWLFQISG